MKKAFDETFDLLAVLLAMLYACATGGVLLYCFARLVLAVVRLIDRILT